MDEKAQDNAIAQEFNTQFTLTQQVEQLSGQVQRLNAAVAQLQMMMTQIEARLGLMPNPSPINTMGNPPVF